MIESTIVYENGPYWVKKAVKGFEVYRSGITHSERCASIGYEGSKGLALAIAETDRRAGQR